MDVGCGIGSSSSICVIFVEFLFCFFMGKYLIFEISGKGMSYVFLEERVIGFFNYGVIFKELYL